MSGEYQVTPALSITISLENGRLQAQPTGQQKATLFGEGPDMFFLRIVNAQVRFTRTTSGEVTGLVLYQGGSQQTGRKVR